ncbi:BRF1-domain-containing protein [Microstroma glucosiphilum]|uniref:B-related factor 1 n=1 Tax=Pseudomicrostroma glucosiphilum TaxID=1684307 RepID=A0A316U797_9BASI|nr:BRF1-domain-containing protein [Pseudomicrostroma glucosiphilum]PWN21117.1 BRF1-domain-containing protein [Pseudomicrostroma glucosiphilum]
MVAWLLLLLMLLLMLMLMLMLMLLLLLLLLLLLMLSLLLLLPVLLLRMVMVVMLVVLMRFCGSNQIHSHNSSVYCQACGTVQEESQIVSDVTFGENSAGGAVVQGSYVSAGQSHVRSSNPRFRSGGVGESREQTMSRAREAIQRMGRANRVSLSTCEKALRWFNLALDGVPEVPLQNGLPQPKNYILGRKQEYTVAACLYVACRYAKTSHLLIDFAEAIDINVFSLGRHYLKLVAALNVKLPVIDPSFYVLRFASLLDFGDETNKVAQDATRLCARFKKDWLGDGRRPAGICGAALLLAARMNNFQRSMNEIVQVVKMADVTIRERLEEFKRTPSGNLTIQDFKEIWLEEEHEPPAFYRPQLEKELKGTVAERSVLKREKAGSSRGAVKARKSDLGSTAHQHDSEEDVESDYHSHEAVNRAGRTTSTESAAEAVLLRKEGGQGLSSEMDALVEEATRQEIGLYTQDEDFKRLAAQAESESLASQRRARLGTKAILQSGRTSALDDSGAKTPLVGDRSSKKRQGSDSLGNTYIQQSTEKSATTGGSDEGHAYESLHLPTPEGLVEAQAGPSQTPVNASVRNRATRETTALPSSAEDATAPIDTLSDLDEDELDQFILGQDEVRIKERVWMEFNHDYLQDALQRRLKEEADVKAGIFKKRGHRRRGSTKGSVRDSNNPSAATAEEATKHMLLRKKTSKKLNYGAIENLFSGQKAATGRDAKQPAHRRHFYGSSRAKHDDGQTSTDIRRATALGLISDGLEDLEEPGAALPTTHPLHRSRAERRKKASRSMDRLDSLASGSSGDESNGHDIGTALTDGATTEGEGADDAELLPWQQQRSKPRYTDEYGDGFDD